MIAGNGKEITRRNVLLECLDWQREKLAEASRDSFMLDAWPGMEEIFAERREKCRILQEMIQALESEPVRRSMAEWQQEIMKQGGPGENIGL